MSERADEITLHCRAARRRFSALVDCDTAKLSPIERAATERHLQTCQGCAREYRIKALGRATLDLAAAPEPIRPDDDFFVALRARIARGPETFPSARAVASSDESWVAALSLTARQLIPAMAMLLVLIIGATLIFNVAPSDEAPTVVLFNNPELTPSDVLETLVAVEERENGR